MQLCGASVMGEILALLNDSRFAGGDFKSSATTNPCRHIPSEDWQARMQALRRSLENALTPLSMEYSVDQANDDHLRALASMLKDIRGGEVPFEKDAFDEVAQKMCVTCKTNWQRGFGSGSVHCRKSCTYPQQVLATVLTRCCSCSMRVATRKLHLLNSEVLRTST